MNREQIQALRKSLKEAVDSTKYLPPQFHAVTKSFETFARVFDEVFVDIETDSTGNALR